MTDAAPLLFDRFALSRRRQRAQDDALFLHRAARDEVEDRLSLVNREFKSPAVITPFPHIWSGMRPNAAIVPDDDILDVQAGAHDLVIHAQCLHAANDPVGQLIQSRRALCPDGLFLGLFLGGRTLGELRASMVAGETMVTGGLSPRFAPMIDIRDAGGLLQRAGFSLPVADLVDLTAEYRDMWHLMRDLRLMGEANALTQRLRHPTRRTVFEAAANVYETQHSTPGGRIAATFDTIVATGWAPDASQPQPLRPGSASNRLAEALGTDELKLPD